MTSNSKCEFVQDPVLVGSSAKADFVIHMDKGLSEHAWLEWKGGQLMLTALGGDPNDLMSETNTFIDDNEIRSQIPYLLHAGARVRFGDGQEWIVECEEKTNVNSFTKNLLQSMASNFSKEGQEAVRKLSDL